MLDLELLLICRFILFLFEILVSNCTNKGIFEIKRLSIDLKLKVSTVNIEINRSGPSVSQQNVSVQEFDAKNLITLTCGYIIMFVRIDTNGF